jgi:signal transduction histidine kinase
MNGINTPITLATLDCLDQDIDSLDSITQCAMSQKRVADDILGLAAIQLEKYNVTPIVVNLAQRLQTVLKIFRRECQAKGIALQLIMGPSFKRLGTAKLAKVDPVRLSQILINLVGRSIPSSFEPLALPSNVPLILASSKAIECHSFRS